MVETYFLSSGNSMLLFIAFFLLLETMIIEIRGNQSKHKSIFLLVKTIFVFLPEEAVFPYSENVLFNKYCISGSGNRFSGLYRLSACFSSRGNIFFNETFNIWHWRRIFSLFENHLLYLRVLSYLVKLPLI